MPTWLRGPCPSGPAKVFAPARSSISVRALTAACRDDSRGECRRQGHLHYDGGPGSPARHEGEVSRSEPENIFGRDIFVGRSTPASGQRCGSRMPLRSQHPVNYYSKTGPGSSQWLAPCKDQQAHFVIGVHPSRGCEIGIKTCSRGRKVEWWVCGHACWQTGLTGDAGVSSAGARSKLAVRVSVFSHSAAHGDL